MAFNRKKAGRIALLAAALMAAAWAYTNYFGVTPLQKIDALLERVRAAAQARDVPGITAELSKDYRDSTGLDRSGLAAMAQQFFETVDSLNVSYATVKHGDPKLPMKATEARAVVVVELTGEQKVDRRQFKGIAGQGSDTFLVNFKKEDGIWKIVSSRRLIGTTPEALAKVLNQKP